MFSNVSLYQNHQVILLHHMARHHFQSFWFSTRGLRPQETWFQQVSRCFWWQWWQYSKAKVFHQPRTCPGPNPWPLEHIAYHTHLILLKAFLQTTKNMFTLYAYVWEKSWGRLTSIILHLKEIQFCQFSRSVMSDSFVTPWTAVCQASLSITNSRSLPKHISIMSVMPSNHLVLCRPLLLPPSIFPSIRVFSNQSTLRIRWLKYWSFSNSPSNEYSGLILLGLTGLISLQSKGLSRVFSSATVQKHQFFVLSLLYGPALTSVHDYWKNRSFDYMDLCWQSDVSAF